MSMSLGHCSLYSLQFFNVSALIQILFYILVFCWLFQFFFLFTLSCGSPFSWLVYTFKSYLQKKYLIFQILSFSIQRIFLLYLHMTYNWLHIKILGYSYFLYKLCRYHFISFQCLIFWGGGILKPPLLELFQYG